MDTPESHTRRGTAAPGGAHLTRTRHGTAGRGPPNPKTVTQKRKKHYSRW